MEREVSPPHQCHHSAAAQLQLQILDSYTQQTSITTGIKDYEPLNEFVDVVIWRGAFAVNHLRWYLQPNQNYQETNTVKIQNDLIKLKLALAKQQQKTNSERKLR